MDIFFHVYLKSGYSHILLDKFKKFKISGLYDSASKIHLTLYGDIELHSEFLNELSNNEVISKKKIKISNKIVSNPYKLMLDKTNSPIIISDKGLILTNHHCGYDNIQSHSTVEHDYLTNGFWAYKMEEELPNKDLFVTFIIRIEDVTDKVLSGATNLTSEADKQKKNQKMSGSMSLRCDVILSR